MSKTIAAGSLLIKHALPIAARKRFDPSIVLNDKEVNRLISQLVEHSPEQAHEVIGELSRLFFNSATQQGFSLSLEDYENKTLERTEILSQLEAEIAKIVASKKSPEEKNYAINAIVEVLKNRLSAQTMKHLLSRGATSAKMAEVGARGNAGQLMQASSSPILGADAVGNPVPIVIRHSYSEGLSPSEAAAMSFGSRQNTVMTQRATALPGDIFKKLTPNLFHEVVTETDCKTTAGTTFPIEDKKAILYRYESATNRLIDEPMYRDLLDGGEKSIRVRTPLTCQAKTGICQHCYGLMADGKLPPIGTNVGVIASQSASEKLTQAILSFKHVGGLAGKQRSAYEEAANLLNTPEAFVDKAVLSPVSGSISAIVETELKDHRIHIGSHDVFVPKEQDILVKLGDHVKAGQPLTTGTINPRELITHVGVSKTREYMSKALRDIYNESPKASMAMSSLDPRHFDLISRNLLKHVTITDPGETGLLMGDEVSFDHLRPILERDIKVGSPFQAEGKILAKSIGTFAVGEPITPKIAEEMQKDGITKVSYSDSGLIVTPIVPGLQKAKLLSKDWVSKLSFNRIRKTIQEASSMGESSDVHGTDPITPYVIGREFGQGENGEY